MRYLTERQREILNFVERFQEQRGVAPTLREIAAAFAFSSTASAQKHLALLEQKGYLRREKHQKRGLVLARSADEDRREGAALPLLGTVAAGAPIESIPERETISVPGDLLRTGEHYVLRVRGDSMIDEGIHDGDFVVVQRAEVARDGDTVVALVDGEVTLKRLFRAAGSTFRLQPANEAVAPILVTADSLRIQGVVVGLLRRY